MGAADEELCAPSKGAMNGARAKANTMAAYVSETTNPAIIKGARIVVVIAHVSLVERRAAGSQPGGAEFICDVSCRGYCGQ